MSVRVIYTESIKHTGPVRILLCLLSINALNAGCKKPFNPVLATTDSYTLVVEGYINTGSDSTIIQLSRTVAVGNKTAVSVETKATVTVENAAGTSYPLPETTIKGTYVSPHLNVDNTRQYRLRIKTVGGKTYLSDFVTPKITPPIDSVGYDIGSDGLSIYANTHDPKNNSTYYRYSFRETWQFHAQYASNFIFSAVDTLLHTRLPSQQIYACFGSDTSAHTILYSTEALSQDVAYHVPIITIPPTSEKIGIKYSILVRQQALTKEAYAFYQSLKKNTEDLGSIFDAQPSQLIGNIHNTAEANEPVIGYIAAGTTTTKRIYILKQTLPQSYQVAYDFSCEIDTAFHYPSHNIKIPPLIRCAACYYVEEELYPNVDGRLDNGPALGLAITLLGAGNKVVTGYTFTLRQCADCTLKGHTQQPLFWK